MTDAEKDAVWRSLPEGFKKEVSRHYKSWHKSLAFGGECAVLDYIFGKHNLSASEEEIQDKTMEKGELLKLRKERRKQTLNIGDKVRAISASGKPLYDGKVATIIEKGMSGDEVYYGLYIEGVAVEKRSTPLIGKSEIIGNTSLLAPFFAEDLELVKSQAEEEKPIFKVGDLVITTQSTPLYGRGWVGSIKQLDGNFASVHLFTLNDMTVKAEIDHLAHYDETKHGNSDSPVHQECEEISETHDSGNGDSENVNWLTYRMELAKELAVELIRSGRETTFLAESASLIANGIVERLKGGENGKYKVNNCVMTCSACPSQWDIYTTDGQYIYARYRWGWLTVTLDPWSENSKELYAELIGDEYDGVMSTTQLKELTKEILEW